MFIKMPWMQRWKSSSSRRTFQWKKNTPWLIKSVDVLYRQHAQTLAKPGANVATKAAFISKLSDSETEAGEVQVWLEIALRCGYIAESLDKKLELSYDHIIGQIVKMIDEPDKWLIRKK